MRSTPFKVCDSYKKVFFSTAEVCELGCGLDEDGSFGFGGCGVNGASEDGDFRVIDLDDVRFDGLLEDHARYDLALVQAGAQDLCHADVVNVESRRLAL